MRVEIVQEEKEPAVLPLLEPLQRIRVHAFGLPLAAVQVVIVDIKPLRQVRVTLERIAAHERRGLIAMVLQHFRQCQVPAIEREPDVAVIENTV